MMEEDKLLSCPFCGETNIRIVDADHPKFWVEYFCECCQCGAMGKQTETKERAIEAWNKRAPFPINYHNENRVDRNKLHKLITNLITCGFRGSKEFIADEHIKEYQKDKGTS